MSALVRFIFVGVLPRNKSSRVPEALKAVHASPKRNNVWQVKVYKSNPISNAPQLLNPTTYAMINSETILVFMVPYMAQVY
jgi:hypothetical protein